MSRNSKQKKVLVVEDETSLRMALFDKLNRDGFNVLRARNGEDGLAVATKERPDIILLDIVMPRMDGVTMLLHLREDSWGKNAKVIMLTNLSEIEKVQECISNGAFDYLVKTDWKIEDIVKKIKSALDS